MRAAIYARLSRNRSGQVSENVQIQDRECTYYVQDQSWRVAGHWSDDDISASKFSRKPRPGYESLVKAVGRGEVEVIVCTEMPRLYRRIEELLDLIRLAERTTLKGIWTTDGIGYDLSTPEGCHAAIAAINNAQLESARLSKRQKRKKKVRAEQGQFNGGGRPYGYEADGVTIKETEADIVREVVTRLIAGESQTGIVRDLNSRSVPTSLGNKWTIGNFKRTIVKKRYIGVREHNGSEYPAVWPAIISTEDHTLMLARLHDASHTKACWPIKGRSYLLSGFLYCGRCGAVMYGSGRDLPDGTYQRRYRCRPYDNHSARIGCGKVFRGADPLDHFISEVLLMRLESAQMATALAPKEDGYRLSELSKQLTGHKLRAKQIAREYSLGEHNKSDYQVMRDALHDAMTAIESELASLQSSQLVSLPRLDLIREVWEEAGTEWRRDVLKLLVDRIVVGPQGSGVKLWQGRWRFDPESIRVSWLR